GHGAAAVERLAHRQRPPRDARAQGLALDVLEREVRPAVVLAERVERHDVRVVEARSRAGLLEESLDAAALHDGALDELQRHRAAEREVLREVDLAHAALAEEAANPEPADDRALGEQRIVPWVPHRAPAWSEPEADADRPVEPEPDVVAIALEEVDGGCDL